MFKLEKQSDKAVLTIYGYVGGYYMDMRAVNMAISDIQQSGYNQLDFHMHTYGGYIVDGNMIYNFLAGFKGNVDIYIDGVAASMGSIIMLAGAKIHIAENGFVMIHSPSGSAEGNAADLIATADLLNKMEKNFKQKLMERTGKSEADVNAWFDGVDHWFDADECVSMKLADDKFTSKVSDIETLNTQDASQLGAKAVYERFAALTSNTFNQISKREMDKKTLIARYNLTDVTENSTDEEILAAVDTKMKAAEDAAKATTKKAIEAAVDAAIETKKINKEQRDKYIARGEKLGLDELNALFAEMNAYDPISAHITGGEGSQTDSKDDKARAGWTWDDYQAKDSAALETMQQKDPAKFKALFKAKYGKEPEV